jgi:hypothetical protein
MDGVLGMTLERKVDLKIVPFEPWHIFEVASANPDGKLTAENLKRQVIVNNLHRLISSYTLIRNGHPVGCGGLYPDKDKTALGWIYLSPLECACSMWLMKRLKVMLADKIVELNVERVDVIVLKTFAQGRRFAEFLGFEMGDDTDDTFFFMSRSAD